MELSVETKNKPKIALIHDFLTAYGGAERVLDVFCEMFPEAPIYTLLHDKEKMRGKFEKREIRTSFLQKFPKFFRKRQKYLLPFLPVAPETFDLREYDLVLSSSGAWTKGIITRLNTKHVAYLHSPMRFVWDENEKYLKEQNKKFFFNFFARNILNYIRIWDRVAAERPDYLISNSKYTQSRVEKYYRRESQIIYPPVEVKTQNSNLKPGKYFLVVSRLSPYKKIDSVIQAFNKLNLPLIVVGEGQQEKYLRKIAGENVKILGWQKEGRLSEIYSGARAFVFAGVDDFGIAPVEAMNFGLPVLSLRKGGALEIVEEGKTGEFFDVSTAEVIADCVRRFLESENGYDREYIKKSAERFTRDNFIKNFNDFLEEINSKW